MGGNHDWWGGRYLREEIGIELDHPVTRDLAGHCTYKDGDGLGTGDAAIVLSEHSCDTLRSLRIQHASSSGRRQYCQVCLEYEGTLIIERTTKTPGLTF